MRLTFTGANFNIVRKASLRCELVGVYRRWWTRDTHPHGRVKRPGNLVVLFQSRTATQNLGQPELPYGALHVRDFALSRHGRAHPL